MKRVMYFSSYDYSEDPSSTSDESDNLMFEDICTQLKLLLKQNYIVTISKLDDQIVNISYNDKYYTPFSEEFYRRLP